LDGAAAAEKRGTFRRTNPDAITEAEWELIVDEPLQPVDPSSQLIPPLQPLEGTPPVSGGQVGVKERIKKVVKKGDLVDAFLDLRQPPDALEATNEFERIFGFGALPWSSTSTWTKFQKFIVGLHTSDPGIFADYVAWRAGDGKYKAFSNRKIRENPSAFMDTGYPEYEASKMYRRTDEVRPEYKPVQPDPNKDKYVQRPNHIPRPNIATPPAASD
jgi:hypothetical protein